MTTLINTGDVCIMSYVENHRTPEERNVAQLFGYKETECHAFVAALGLDQLGIQTTVEDEHKFGTVVSFIDPRAKLDAPNKLGEDDVLTMRSDPGIEPSWAITLTESNDIDLLTIELIGAVDTPERIAALAPLGFTVVETSKAASK